MSNEVNYDVKKDPWYSPVEVIDRFEQLRSMFGEKIDDPIFKTAHEMFSAAIAVLGSYVLSSENKYFLQVNKQGRSPDVMAAKQLERDGKPIQALLTQIEVVKMDDHWEGNDVVEFLKAKKLYPVKDYDENTTILCIVNKKIMTDSRDIARRLGEITPKIRPTIYINGRVGENEEEEFSIFTPYPRPTRIYLYKVPKVVAAYSLPRKIRFHFEIAHKITYSKGTREPTDIYEMFGLEKEKKRILKKFKIIV